MTPAPKNLITDVPGILVGNATNASIDSGTTVLTTHKKRLAAAVHVMGGAPGTRETDLLAPDRLVTHIDAITLSGGSAFGLDAATGVMEALKAQSRGEPVHHLHVPIVPAAIIFDLITGDQSWSTSPYPTLGREAFHNASDTFDLGSTGAGTGALAGRDKGGLGSASLTLENGITIGALVVVNPLGNTRTKSGQFYAAPFELNNEFGNSGTPGPGTHNESFDTKLPRVAKMAEEAKTANTTIAIVATDATLTKPQLTRLATTAHGGLAKAINPSHTPFDGDLVFAVSTEDRPEPDPHTQMQIGHAAAITLARAIARGVYAAQT